MANDSLVQYPPDGTGKSVDHSQVSTIPSGPGSTPVAVQRQRVVLGDDSGPTVIDASVLYQALVNIEGQLRQLNASLLDILQAHNNLNATMNAQQVTPNIVQS